MAPTQPEKRTIKEIKAHREKKKKWKESNLIKKIQKEKLKTQSQESFKEAVAEHSVPLKEIPTVSIAVPGSILENAQSPVLRSYLAGQIARAACLFQVDEVVIFDDYADEANAKKSTLEDEEGTKTIRQCCLQLGRILQYLECPQYLRKYFFPMHDDLKFAGVLNPLDAPHHLRQDNNFAYREGVVSNKPVKPGRGSQVNVGLLQDVHVDKLLTAGIRCTVKLLPPEEGSKKIKGLIVSPKEPKQETGAYWGYEVRLANSLSQVFTKAPFSDGYDLTIGTSDKGTPIDEFKSPTYKHLLIVFGGLTGLEAALENDDKLKVDDPKLLFDHYVNTLPHQGSRTIRTEEAILISLTALRPTLNLNTMTIKEPTTLENPEIEEVPQEVDDMDRFD